MLSSNASGAFTTPPLPPNDEEAEVNETEPLLQQRYAFTPSGEVFYKSKFPRFLGFFKPDKIIESINNMNLFTDTLIGIGAGANETFDEWVQSEDSLALFIPVYLMVNLFMPLIFSACYSKYNDKFDAEGREQLKMQAEDRLLLALDAEAIDDIKDEFIQIQIDRKEVERGNTYRTHVPTFLLNVALHLAYVFCLAFMEEDDKGFFVENFDWLSPALLFATLFSLSTFNEKYYGKNQEAAAETEVDQIITNRAVL